jgi:hypothetical protein
VYTHTDGREQKDNPGKPEGIIAIANAIPDMRALTSINVENNNIPGAQEEEIYQQVRMHKLRAALRDEALTELDVSGIGFGAEGVPLVAKYISGNRAISTLTFGDTQAVTMTTKMTEANFSGKLYSYEAQIVAAFLPKCT